MNRHLLAAPLCAGVLLLGVAGVASAQDIPSPGSEECAAARQVVAGLEAQVEALRAGPPGTLSLDALRAAVRAAVDADNTAGAAVDSEATVQAKAALIAREGQILAVEVELVAATDAAETACAAPTVPPPSTTPPPTPTVVPPPTPAPTETPAPSSSAPPEVVYFTDCSDARAAGAAPLGAADAGYRAGLDSDRDGVACEDSDPDTAGSGVDTSGGGVDLSQGIETGT